MSASTLPTATLLTTIVYGLDEVTPAVWSSLREICSARKTIISILYAKGHPSQVHSELQDDCYDIILFYQSEVMETEDWMNRKQEVSPLHGSPPKQPPPL